MKLEFPIYDIPSIVPWGVGAGKGRQGGSEWARKAGGGGGERAGKKKQGEGGWEGKLEGVGWESKYGCALSTSSRT